LRRKRLKLIEVMIEQSGQKSLSLNQDPGQNEASWAEKGASRVKSS